MSDYEFQELIARVRKICDPTDSKWSLDYMDLEALRELLLAYDQARGILAHLAQAKDLMNDQGVRLLVGLATEAASNWFRGRGG